MRIEFIEMDTIIEFFQNLTSPEWIANNGGLWLIAFIVFAETGLFIGFFLPGDALIFITGTIVAKANTPTENHFINLLFWIGVLTLCAIIGNIVGYWFGKKSGNYLFERRDTWLFKKRHIHQAKEFYDKRGPFAVVVARFFPVIRTFAPIIAGVVKMDYKKFYFFNVLGALLWIASFTTAGFFLGQNAWVKEHFEYIIIGLVAVTSIPVIIKMLFGSKKKTKISTTK